VLPPAAGGRGRLPHRLRLSSRVITIIVPGHRRNYRAKWEICKRRKAKGLHPEHMRCSGRNPFTFASRPSLASVRLPLNQRWTGATVQPSRSGSASWSRARPHRRAVAGPRRPANCPAALARTNGRAVGLRAREPGRAVGKVGCLASRRQLAPRQDCGERRGVSPTWAAFARYTSGLRLDARLAQQSRLDAAWHEPCRCGEWPG